MRLTDGVIIVVDSSQSVNASTQTIIQRSIDEKLKIILFINNIDTSLLTVGAANLDSLYHDLEETITDVTNLISQCTTDKTYAISIMQNVAFGCTKEGWAFKLHSFTDTYSKTFSKFDKDKFVTKLWAEHYYSFEVCLFIFMKRGCP